MAEKDNDLEEFVGENAMRAKHARARERAREKLAKIMLEKAIPLQREIAMHDDIIAAINRREGIGEGTAMEGTQET